MSGLIKQVLGTLGVFMLIVGHSHAQNTPTQNTPNSQAAPSSEQLQQNTQPIAADNSANGAVDGHNQARPNNVSPNDANSNNAQALPPINNSQNPHQLGNNVDQGNPVGQTPSQTPSQAPNSSAPQSNSTPQGVAQPLPPINMDSISDADLNSTEPVQDNSSSSALTHEPTSPVGVDASTLPHDLSPYGMFMQADFVVKAVMIGLASASLLTWVIFVAKTLELGIAKAKMRSAVRQIVAATSLAEVVEQFANKKNVSGRLVNAAANEVRMSINAVDGAGSGGVKERVTSALSRIEAHAGRRMAGGSAILATIGSISPFVGLFGTVWGIMNAFIGISKSQVTNLAVVAPGIAEALLATAIGLVAAIPAVVIYNYLAKSIVGYRQIVSDASTGIERLVSRDLDFREAQRKSPRTVQPLAAE